MEQAFLKLLLESKECIMALLTMLGIEDKTDDKKKSVKTRAKKTVAKIGALILLLIAIIQYQYGVVPDVEGLEYKTASIILAESNFKGTLCVEDGKFVISQDPKAGSIIKKASKINLEFESIPAIKQTKKEIDDELENLYENLKSKIYDEEYILVDGQGKEIEVEKELDFRNLISILDRYKDKYYYFTLAYFMQNKGYPVEDKGIVEAADLFFELDYNKQSEILAQLFFQVGTHTYKVATEYEYTVTQDENGESQVQAEVTKVETREIPIFIMRYFSYEVVPQGKL